MSLWFYSLEFVGCIGSLLWVRLFVWCFACGFAGLGLVLDLDWCGTLVC